MRIALDPYMYRHLSLGAMVDKTAEPGYDYIELSPREDFFRARRHKARYSGTSL
ncbi:hypothetical protein BV360_04089 [Pseudomonas syringae pv. actinidiae]|uniref:Sugar phosphate isomerase/epimerase n=1 Tax=Pseudomonas syringae pv. actinidiae TaxID=103796 RepID=A0A2V0QG64_PSESF|nr:AP endonuclease [Pseudomonas syringae pv. actinidiae]EPM45183.1 AP endonuclease [Pseudomonas syringae pv. actinidiae ICMP 19098]EPN16177.1 AP endonuclease [Pseudomonas syringae pv. actinidiae ICMP 19100]EPN26311.1 AP endonuclease [Pseudomonas syringae pv. actinidiae ICMP 19099]EPN32196.1 AP endonuclease [Pseudomonas syringae pv. actinidiae ICMP 18883]EPN40760.1 AP endonuclease [Pseudomonas syringae pv. actinidiae ICMP 19095]EPN51072.1 AP endonuclease [Pseudomonas syringae pv. actinidiae IC